MKKKIEDPILSFNKQCTKYPVYKDVKKLWSFDYKAEEKKRFKGEVMWDPSYLSE